MLACYFALMQRQPFQKQGETTPADSYSRPELRVQQIETMIEHAEVKLEHDNQPPPDVKIAICPEHFLAKQHGKPISNSSPGRFFNEINEVIPILQQLTIISKKWPSWLIIPGSITVFGMDSTLGKNISQKTLYTDDNLGKTNFLEGHARAQNASLKKELDATLSFINKNKAEQAFRPCYNVAPIYLNGQIIKIRRKKYEAYDEVRSLDIIGTGSESAYFPMGFGNAVFKHKGLDIGVEICVEHEHGLLRAEAPAGLDLHIIISNTVTPFSEHASLKENGALVHVDSRSTGVYQKNELLNSSDSENFIPKNSDANEMYFIRQSVGVEDSLRIDVGK